MANCAIAYLVLMYERQTISLGIATIVFVTGFIWPHLAYILSRKSKNQRKTESYNMLFDSFFIGMYVAFSSFSILYTFAVILQTTLVELSIGGIRLLAKGLTTMVFGCLAIIAFSNIEYIPDTGNITTIVIIAQSITYSILFGNMIYNQTLKYISLKRVVEHKNLELTDAIQNIKDINSKLDKAYKDIEHDLDIAHKIQSSIIPILTPTSRHYEIAVKYCPMRKIGGDYYDIHDMGDRLNVIIADVSGHGIPAALIASMIKILFFIYKSEYSNPSHLLSEMNTIVTGLKTTQFVTAGIVQIDFASKTIYHANAGHNPLFILKSNGECMESSPRGKAMGWLEDLNYNYNEITFEKGDRLVLYTDGITEAMNENNELLGEERLIQEIKESKQLEAHQFTETLYNKLLQWIGLNNTFKDDVTLMVIDIK